MSPLSNKQESDVQGFPESWTPIDLPQRATNPPEPPAIGGILYEGQNTIISGASESMKTWFCLALAKQEMEIGYAVAWIDVDGMGEGMILERLRQLGASDEQISALFLYINQPSESLLKNVEAIRDGFVARGTRLVVFDAFNSTLSLDALDYMSTPDVEGFWRGAADPLKNAGMCPVVIDHPTKNTENQGKHSGGSQRKHTGSDVHLRLEGLGKPLTRGGEGESKVRVNKDRPAHLTRDIHGIFWISAALEPYSFGMKAYDPAGFRPTVLMEKVYRLLGMAQDALSQNTILTSVGGKKDRVVSAIDKLLEEGVVSEERGERNARMFSLTDDYNPYFNFESEAAQAPRPTSPHLTPTMRSTPCDLTSPPPPPLKRGEVEVRVDKNKSLIPDLAPGLPLAGQDADAPGEVGSTFQEREQFKHFKVSPSPPAVDFGSNGKHSASTAPAPGDQARPASAAREVVSRLDLQREDEFEGQL